MRGGDSERTFRLAQEMGQEGPLVWASLLSFAQKEANTMGACQRKGLDCYYLPCDFKFASAIPRWKI